jgi:predicted GNAT family acetyltransferase
VWTPPWRLLLSLMPGPAALALADAMHGWRLQPSGAVGPTASTTPICQRLAAHYQERAVVARAMRAFVLETVTPVPAVPGRCRRAVGSETALVSDWYVAFWRDAGLQDPSDPREAGAVAVREGRVFIWDDAGPRSLAAMGRTTPGGASLGPVFTPLAARRRGYATALVAAASQTILDEGHRFCCLFTDLSNPTSNSIYPKIGYRPVCDFTEIDLGRR